MKWWIVGEIRMGLARVGDRNRGPCEEVGGRSYSAVQGCKQHLGKTVVLRSEESKTAPFAVVSEPNPVHVLNHLLKYCGL